MTASSGSASESPLAPVIPLFSVVRGTPTPAELAALVAVLATRGGAPEEPAPVPSAWSAKAAGLRKPMFPGPDAWRQSAR